MSLQLLLLFSFAPVEYCISVTCVVQICKSRQHNFEMKYFTRGDFNVHEVTVMCSGGGRHCIRTDVGQKLDWWNLKRVVLPLKTMLQDVSLPSLSLLPQPTPFICLAALLHNDQNFSYPTYPETKSKHSHNNQTAYPVSPYSDTPTYLLSQVCLTKLDPQY